MTSELIWIAPLMSIKEVFVSEVRVSFFLVILGLNLEGCLRPSQLIDNLSSSLSCFQLRGHKTVHFHIQFSKINDGMSRLEGDLNTAEVQL